MKKDLADRINELVDMLEAGKMTKRQFFVYS